MTLNQLKYVIEIARTGSINKAASNLFISQPVLSASIKSLETEWRETTVFPFQPWDRADTFRKGISLLYHTDPYAALPAG